MDNNQSPQGTESGETFDVLFRGEILPGSDMEATKEQVAKSFKLDGAALDRLFSGSVISLKRNIDRETAERIFQRLYSAGAMAKIVRSLPRQADLEKESPPDSKPFTVVPPGRRCVGRFSSGPAATHFFHGATGTSGDRANWQQYYRRE